MPKELVIPNITTYFLFKPEIRTHNVCYNAYSKCYKDCQEPECELAGFSTNSISEQRKEVKP